ncbi:MAG: family 16 glycosylhydrolase [Streptosporangiaceae bacterium]
MRRGASHWGRLFFGGLCVVAVITGLAYVRPALARHDHRQWGEIWSDDFAGAAGRGVDTANWTYQTGAGVFGNGSVETMTSSPSNVHLDGQGDLDITALQQNGAWTSGRIKSRTAFTPPAGGEMKVTASLRQPDPADGLGYWPAFWMLGQGSWPAHGEIDILEDVNGRSDHSGSFHCGNLTQPNGDGTFGPCHEHTGLSSGMLSCAGCQAGYNTYTVIIDRRDPADERIAWYLDGREFHSVSETEVGAGTWNEAVNHGFWIIFDLAIGGSYPDGNCQCSTPVAQTTSGGTMSVHYVAVYER